MLARWLHARDSVLPHRLLGYDFFCVAPARWRTERTNNHFCTLFIFIFNSLLLPPRWAAAATTTTTTGATTKTRTWALVLPTGCQPASQLPVVGE